MVRPPPWQILDPPLPTGALPLDPVPQTVSFVPPLSKFLATPLYYIMLACVRDDFLSHLRYALMNFLQTFVSWDKDEQVLGSKGQRSRSPGGAYRPQRCALSSNRLVHS